MSLRTKVKSRKNERRNRLVRLDVIKDSVGNQVGDIAEVVHLSEEVTRFSSALQNSFYGRGHAKFLSPEETVGDMRNERQAYHPQGLGVRMPEAESIVADIVIPEVYEELDAMLAGPGLNAYVDHVRKEEAAAREAIEREKEEERFAANPWVVPDWVETQLDASMQLEAPQVSMGHPPPPPDKTGQIPHSSRAARVEREEGRDTPIGRISLRNQGRATAGRPDVTSGRRKTIVADVDDDEAADQEKKHGEKLAMNALASWTQRIWGTKMPSWAAKVKYQHDYNPFGKCCC